MHLERGAAPGDVRRSAMDAIEEFGSHSDLLALIRDIDGQYSPDAHYFRLLVHGGVPGDHALRSELKGYYVTYDVVAETVEQALEFVREFENAEISAADLSVEESKVLEQRPKDPMGVYRRTDRCSYKDEE